MSGFRYFVCFDKFYFIARGDSHTRVTEAIVGNFERSPKKYQESFLCGGKGWGV